MPKLYPKKRVHMSASDATLFRTYLKNVFWPNIFVGASL